MATTTPDTRTEQRFERTTDSPGGHHPAPGAATNQGSGRAIASLVLGLLSIPAFLFPILGVVLGAVAVGLGVRAKSDAEGPGGSGRWQAVTGIVLGAIGIIVAVAVWALAVANAT